MVFKENEGGIIISKDCVDIISTSADPTRNFYRVRFRNPKLFVGGKYSTPQWGQKAAMTIGTKYYGVKGCKITMAQPVGGRWMIQSVLIPKNGGVEMNEELALKIANHIQDRIEREGQWTAVMCRDNETKRYISKINGQHIERDERGRFAPHAAEEEYINPYGGPNDPDYLKEEWIDKVYYNIDSGRWIPLPSGYKRGCSPHNFMYNRMVNMNTYTDEILSPHDNFNLIFRCMMCGMEVDRQIRISDNYFAGISPITAPHRAEEFGADSTWRVNTCTHKYEDTEEEAFSDYSAWKLRDSEVCMGDGSSGYVETGVRCDICGQERIGSWAIENENEGFQITKGEEGRMPRNYGWTSVNELFGAEDVRPQRCLRRGCDTKTYNGKRCIPCSEYFSGGLKCRKPRCSGYVREAQVCDSCGDVEEMYGIDYTAEEFGADDFCMTCGAKDKNPTSEGACDECVCIGSGCDSPKSGKSYSYCELCYERENPEDTDYDKSGYYSEEFGAESKLTKEEIIEYLLSNSADYLNDGLYYKVNEDTWTLSDLFIRQYLNNLVDGFGMVNVMEVYQYLCKHKDLLIEYNMVSKDGWNNSGLTLWENYNFDDYLERFGAEEFGAWDANCSVCNGTGWMPNKGDPKKDAKIAKLFGLSIDELTLTPCNAGGKSMGCWSSKNRNRLRRLQRAESFGAEGKICMVCGDDNNVREVGGIDVCELHWNKGIPFLTEHGAEEFGAEGGKGMLHKLFKEQSIPLKNVNKLRKLGNVVSGNGTVDYEIELAGQDGLVEVYNYSLVGTYDKQALEEVGEGYFVLNDVEERQYGGSDSPIKNYYNGKSFDYSMEYEKPLNSLEFFYEMVYGRAGEMFLKPPYSKYLEAETFEAEKHFKCRSCGSKSSDYNITDDEGTTIHDIECIGCGGNYNYEYCNSCCPCEEQSDICKCDTGGDCPVHDDDYYWDGYDESQLERLQTTLKDSERKKWWKLWGAENFGAEDDEADDDFEAQQFFSTCSDKQFEIFGRKLYYKCRNVGSVMNQKISGFGDGGLGSYKGGQYALRLAGGMNKYDIMNTLAEVSNDMKPNTMADWRGVVSATNQIISVKNAEEWGAEAFEAFDFLTYCEPCENYTTHYFREEFCDVCNNKYNNEELHSEGLEAQRGVKS